MMKDTAKIKNMTDMNNTQAEKSRAYTGRKAGRKSACNFWKSKSRPSDKAISKDSLLQNLASYLISRLQSKYLGGEAFLGGLLANLFQKAKGDGYGCALEISEGDHLTLRNYINKAKDDMDKVLTKKHDAQATGEAGRSS